MSERSVAAAFGVSRNTVSALVAEWEKLGKVEPLKQRLSRKLGLVVDLASDTIIERLRDGKIPDNVLPILFGIAFDKKSLLDGDPTVRVEERVELALSPTDLRAMLESMKRAKSPDNKVIDLAPAEPTSEAVSDSQSDVSEPY
jgi:transposase